MEILLILSFAVLLSSLAYDSQKTVNKIDKVAPRERVIDKLANVVLREGAFKIIIALILFIAIIGLLF